MFHPAIQKITAGEWLSTKKLMLLQMPLQGDLPKVQGWTGQSVAAVGIQVDSPPSSPSQ